MKVDIPTTIPPLWSPPSPLILSGTKTISNLKCWK
jgi:hypothetical protein